MANQLTLIQARLPDKLVKKLDKAQKKAGILTRAEFLRQIVSAFIETQEAREKN